MNSSSKLHLWKYSRSLAQCAILVVLITMFHNNVCISQTEEFETPLVLNANKILPPELLEGINFRVFDEVITYGFINYYTITTSFGTFEAEGDDMLQTRIQEVRAIAAMREVKKTKAFGKAAKQAAMSPFKGAWVSGTPPG